MMMDTLTRERIGNIFIKLNADTVTGIILWEYDNAIRVILLDLQCKIAKLHFKLFLGEGVQHCSLLCDAMS